MPTLHDFMAEARRSKSDYRIYHDTYTDAVDEAIALARRKGYEIVQSDYESNVTFGPRKPSIGRTRDIKLELTKNGKPTKHMLVFQVYGMKNQYELTAYVS